MLCGVTGHVVLHITLGVCLFGTATKLSAWQYVMLCGVAGHVVLHTALGRTDFKGLKDFEDIERQEALKRCDRTVRPSIKFDTVRNRICGPEARRCIMTRYANERCYHTVRPSIDFDHGAKS